MHSQETDYMEIPKRRILMNAFFKGQFNYCPVVWMFHSCSLNNKINRSSFEGLLVKDNSISLHHYSIFIVNVKQIESKK